MLVLLGLCCALSSFARAGHARQHSTISETHQFGFILFKDSNGMELGALKDYGALMYTLVPLGERATVFELETLESGKQLNIKPTTPLYNHNPYLGTVFGPPASNQADPATSALVNTRRTPAGSLPQQVGNAIDDQLYSESAIWSYDSSNNNLNVTWIGLDGEMQPMTIFYSDTSYAVHVTTDPHVPDTLYSGDATVGTLHFVQTEWPPAIDLFE